MMVYGWTPFITMCAGGGFGLGEAAPGSLTHTMKLLADPSPFWAPPVPTKSKLGEMSGLVVAADSSLWGLYRCGEAKHLLHYLQLNVYQGSAHLWRSLDLPVHPSIFRGDRIWDMTTFDGSNKVTAKKPIAVDVVARMDADTGSVLSSWGANTFYMPHMLTVDREGNVWVVDCGLHQVNLNSFNGWAM